MYRNWGATSPFATGRNAARFDTIVSGLPVSVKKFASAVRAHWGIENYLLNCLAAIIRDTVALGGARGTEVGREGGVVSFDVGGHVLATGGEAVNVYASIPTHRYVRR